MSGKLKVLSITLSCAVKKEHSGTLLDHGDQEFVEQSGVFLSSFSRAR